jgi:cold shock CspA family protein/ribosome-associated translation inhibitor RaiA
MQVPLQLSFKNVRRTPEVEGLIREKADKLGKVCDYLSSCRVAVEKPQKHINSGNPYRVRIDMTVSPGHELVVKNEAGRGNMHDPLDVVIRDAFDTASRRLRKLVTLQHGKIKAHATQQVAAIVHKLFPVEGYGFLRTVDTQDEIYFHKNSVLHGEFDRLSIGTGVRYTAEEGQNGLQATTVQIVDAQRTPIASPYRG